MKNLQLPQRYIINDSNDGRILTCLEAPNISVRIAAGLTVIASAAQKSSPGTIYLDGVAQCEPFMNLEKHIYNFDHHEGCVRPFTLSTCEQVLVMVLKGLNLRGRDWRVFANEPDLDTVLAIWLLFNHLRVNKKDISGLNRLFALVRLEGIIDTHGLEMTHLSAFPSELLSQTKKIINYLRTEEVNLKKDGLWADNDALEYTAFILQQIDKIIYKSDDFHDFKEFKELARVEIGNNRIAVVVEAELGIYEIEPYLNRIYGDSLGVVILKKGVGIYTLRRMDPFMPSDLNDVYQILNSIDPNVTCRKNSSRWGGSGDIGGSPRGKPTKLTPKEIAQTCREAFQKTTIAGKTIHFFYTLLLVGSIIGAAQICKFYSTSIISMYNSTQPYSLFVSNMSFFVALIAFTILALAILSHTKWSRFGIRIPTGKDWWFLLPIIILAAFAYGIYVPQHFFTILDFKEKLIFIILIVPLASELLFRSLVHGILAKGVRIQNCWSEWFFSFPTVVSALLYAAFVVYLVVLPNILSQNDLPMRFLVNCIFASIVYGMAACFVRERSQSIFPSIIFHSAAMTIFVILNTI